MDHKWAVFGRINDYLGEVSAKTEQEALAKANLRWAYPVRVILIKAGGDLGVDGLH